jgi:ATP-dependent DNA helicase RecG
VTLALDEANGLRELRGVGPARAARLAAAGLRTPRELLLCLPARLEVAPEPLTLAAALAQAGELVRVRARVRSWRFSRFGRRSLVRVTLQDDSGTADALFFNQPWLRERFAKDEQLELCARVVDAKGPALAVTRLAPAGEALPAPGALTPVYSAPPGMSSEAVARLVAQARERFGALLEERLEPALLARLDLPDLPRAAAELNAPSSCAAFERARRRVFLEGLLALQRRLAARRAAPGEARAIRLRPGERARLAQAFPFAFTRAQELALDDLERDLARTQPMRRLLQGDVGSGKTAVGAWAALAVAAHGAQTAFLAPTELLAEQHFAALAPRFAAAGVRAVLLTGSLGAPRRAEVLAQLAAGTAHVAFGTHALFSADVRFAALALAVIDEQHRFGVSQRRRLLEKGRDVHALLMTATPIPRSLALTVYGDLEVTLIGEKPPGRGRVLTRWLRGSERLRLRALLERELAAGGQAYWVVPRIEGSSSGAEGAAQRHAELAAGPLARFGVELVHGRLDALERERRLARFRAGETRLLVATTVIEVGVDVPAASAIVIEEAQRLGLAQLHQLRGRVGRGRGDARCWLLGAAAAKERFEFLERSDDGFALAEEDLRRRGMGDLLGLRQAGGGVPGPEAGDALERDLDLLLAARDVARADQRSRS